MRVAEGRARFVSHRHCAAIDGGEWTSAGEAVVTMLGISGKAGLVGEDKEVIAGDERAVKPDDLATN